MMPARMAAALYEGFQGCEQADQGDTSVAREESNGCVAIKPSFRSRKHRHRCGPREMSHSSHSVSEHSRSPRAFQRDVVRLSSS